MDHSFVASPTIRAVSQTHSHCLHQQQTISDTGAQASSATGSSGGVTEALAHAHWPMAKDAEVQASWLKTTVADEQQIACAALDNGRAVRREQAREVAKSESAFTDTRSKLDHCLLPSLEDPDWLLSSKCKKYHCREWKREHRCNHGKACYYIHRHGPWGESLEQMWSEMGMRAPPEFEEYAPEFKARAHTIFEDVGTTKWWTAGYISHRRFNAPRQAFYAEGGSARISSQGVSWYSTEEEAYVALKKAAMVSAWAAERRRTPAEDGSPPVSINGFPSNSTSEPQSNLAHANFQRHSDYSYYYAGSAGLHGDRSDQQGHENPYSGHYHQEQRRSASARDYDRRSTARSSSSDYYGLQRPARSESYHVQPGSAHFGSHHVQENGHGQRYSRRYSS